MSDICNGDDADIVPDALPCGQGVFHGTESFGAVKDTFGHGEVIKVVGSTLFDLVVKREVVMDSF